jgi:pSer/pThr/pTyr-binding forkhead associated (FHA) protein/RNA polymerase subunit RPABC4/transcription elongation factor Spt4
MISFERNEVGVACGRCDVFSPRGTEHCPECGSDLSILPAGQGIQAIAPGTFSKKPKVGSQSIPFGARSSDGAATTGGSGATDRRPEEQAMDQARYFVCESCMTPVPSGHKFCGRCGSPVPETMLHQPVDFYSDMQDPARARLILIRGEGMDGLSYHLKADQHIVGRAGQVEFPDDPFVSPKHANFFYRDNRLVVRDEGSLNGVYFRIRGSVEISPGDTFLAGEQVFRLDPTPKASDGADPDGTFFYSSPKYPSAFRLNQILEGGSIGMTVCTRGSSIQIGREDGDLNFPADVYMSARHATVEEREGKYYLTDMDSRNGTYLRIKAERPLGHGDYVFIGRRLLRVELNSN